MKKFFVGKKFSAKFPPLERKKTNISSFEAFPKIFPLPEVSQERNTPPQDEVPKKTFNF